MIKTNFQGRGLNPNFGVGRFYAQRFCYCHGNAAVHLSTGLSVTNVSVIVNNGYISKTKRFAQSHDL